MSRLVAVDDSNGGVQYSGPWTVENGQAWEKQGNFGDPFLSSLHTLKGGTGSFSFTFDGSDGLIYGTTNVGKTASGAQDPVWSCQIDGTTIPAAGPFQFTENNWVFCKWENMAVGKHTITVTVTSETRPFMFDQFRYVPSPTADVSNSYIVVDQDDKALSYGAGWQGLVPVGRMAPDGGAVVTLPFYGSGISWWGTTPKELPRGSSSAEYTIDGGSPVPFTVPGTTDITQYFRFYFQTATLALGHHTLQVTSRGKTSLTPLVLSSLVIQGGSVQEPAVSGTPPASGGTTGGETIGGSDRTSPASPNTTIETTIETSIVTEVAGGSTIVSDMGVTTIDTRLPTATGVTTAAGGNDAPIQTTSAVAGAVSNGFSGNADSTTTSITVPDGKNNGVSIGAIVGAALGGIVLIIIIICLVLFYRRRKSRQQLIQELEHAQPFYRDDLVANHAVSSQASLRASGTNGSALSPTGATRGSTPAGRALMMVSNHDGNRPYSTSTYTEGASAYSTASLLQPNRRGSTEKHQLHLDNSSASQRIVNHQDSGLRMPTSQSVAPLPHEMEVVEFPPQYSAS